MIVALGVSPPDPDDAQYGYLDDRSRQAWQLLAIANRTVEAILNGEHTTAFYDHRGERRAVIIDATHGALNLWRGKRAALTELAITVVNSYVYWNRKALSDGETPATFAEVASALPSSIIDLATNDGDPGACRRGLTDALESMSPVKQHGDGWCDTVAIYGKVSPQRLYRVRDCEPFAACRIGRDLRVVRAPTPSRAPTEAPAPAPDRPTKADIEADITAELEAETTAELEQRIAEQGRNALIAYVALYRGLDMPEDSSPEDVAREMVARGLTATEAVDWVVACDYNVGCFRRTMHQALEEAEKRQRATRALAALSLAGTAVLGTAIYVLAKK